MSSFLLRLSERMHSGLRDERNIATHVPVDFGSQSKISLSREGQSKNC